MQGVELMIFGVTAVVVFLSLLVLVTSLTSRLMSRFFPETATPRVAASARSEPRAPDGPGPGELVAVITAAIHQHRKQRH